MTEINSLYARISEFLEVSEKTGKVDLEIINPLRKLSDEFEEMESYWIKTSSKGTLEDSFSMYHAARNCRLVIRKMINRFEISAKAGDNPRVADDSETVLPIIFDIHSLLTEAQVGTPQKFRNRGFERIRALRNIASIVDMIADEDSDIEAIPPKTRAKSYACFEEIVAGIISDNKGSSRQ